MNIDFRLLRNMDWVLILTVLVLGGIGVAVSASAVRSYNPMDWELFVYKQVGGIVLGLLAMTIILLFDYTEFSRMYRFLYFTNLVLLTLVLVPGIGSAQNGAQSWYKFGSIGLQPAELTKIFTILTLGWMLSITETRHNWFDALPSLGHILPSVALIMKQPDLGTTLVLLAVVAAMIYMNGFSGWRMVLVGAIGVALVGSVVFVNVKYGVKIPGVSAYQIKRIQCWVNPEFDRQDACYNVYQSVVAIGSGGLTGKGLFQGTQTQLGFVPENHTDFIFSVVGEELGFVGGIVILVLFLVLLWRIMNAAMHAKDRYGALICAGVAAMIGFHVLENAGMAIGMMPVTGIPLPFISYGPTAIVANMTAIGLVLNVFIRRQTIMF